MSHSVTQRTSEVGVPMKLGATRSQILRLLLGFGVSAVLLAVASTAGYVPAQRAMRIEAMVALCLD